VSFKIFTLQDEWIGAKVKLLVPAFCLFNLMDYCYVDLQFGAKKSWVIGGLTRPLAGVVRIADFEPK